IGRAPSPRPLPHSPSLIASLPSWHHHRPRSARGALCPPRLARSPSSRSPPRVGAWGTRPQTHLLPARPAAQAPRWPSRGCRSRPWCRPTRRGVRGGRRGCVSSPCSPRGVSPIRGAAGPSLPRRGLGGPGARPPARRGVDKTLLSLILYCHSGSGSMVAIDNKIEQAMDLVKSHLMFAVREEVEVLKEADPGVSGAQCGPWSRRTACSGPWPVPTSWPSSRSRPRDPPAPRPPTGPSS
uniref:TSC22 domain family protein 3 n=1 Tax=Ornithorhynchus anatinus TaxID=9258 RepID=A0A6I8NSN0_ORNAN